MTPRHIVDMSGDRRARCGIRDPNPCVWVAYVQMHIDGRAKVGKVYELCPECAAGGWPTGDAALDMRAAVR